MRCLVAVVLSCMIVAVLSCRRASQDKPTMIDSQLEHKRRALAGTKEGMSEEDVLKLLGGPDEIRTKQEARGWIADAAHAWAYGVRNNGEFAQVGVIFFDADRKVMWVYSPVYSASRPMRDRALNVPFSEQAIATQTGMVCHLEFVAKDPEGSDDIRLCVSLINRGSGAFTFKHDPPAIHKSLLVEVYDADRKLLLRDDQALYHSPLYWGSEDCPVTTIAPGQKKKSDEFFLLSQGSFLGPEDTGVLPPGTYYVRVAFPFEEDKLYPSNLVRFEVPKSQPEN